MKGVSETLAGRMAIVELKGLSFREIHHIEFNKPFIPNEAILMKENHKLKAILICGIGSIEEVCRNFKMKKLIGKDTTLLM